MCGPVASMNGHRAAAGPVPPSATGMPMPCASSEEAGSVTSVPGGSGQPMVGRARRAGIVVVAGPEQRDRVPSTITGWQRRRIDHDRRDRRRERDRRHVRDVRRRPAACRQRDVREDRRVVRLEVAAGVSGHAVDDDARRSQRRRTSLLPIQSVTQSAGAGRSGRPGRRRSCRRTASPGRCAGPAPRASRRAVAVGVRRASGRSGRRRWPRECPGCRRAAAAASSAGRPSARSGSTRDGCRCTKTGAQAGTAGRARQRAPPGRAAARSPTCRARSRGPPGNEVCWFRCDEAAALRRRPSGCRRARRTSGTGPRAARRQRRAQSRGGRTEADGSRLLHGSLLRLKRRDRMSGRQNEAGLRVGAEDSCRSAGRRQDRAVLELDVAAPPTSTPQRSRVVAEAGRVDVAVVVGAGAGSTSKSGCGVLS